MPQQFATLCIHGGVAPDPATGARVTPIYHTNGFVFDDLDHGSDLFALDRIGYAYSRSANPTVAAFERKVTLLEGGKSAIGCASGQGALTMILTALCRSGDAVAVARQCFGGTVGLVRRFESQFNIAVQWFDAHDPDQLMTVINRRTRAILVESLINPTGDPVDLPALVAIADRQRLPLVVDATLATPALQQPITAGAAIVWHSASKFFAGHGQAIGGVIIDSGRSDWIDERYPLIVTPFADYDNIDVRKKYPGWPFAAACRLVGMRELGPSLSPTNAFMLLTAMETLPLRMERHSQTALLLHRALAEHPAVADSSHPGLTHHPRHALAQRLFPDGLGSVQTITLKGGREAARHVTSRLRYFSQLVNVGEAKSLVAHPATTTHRNVDAATRSLLGISEGTLRISTGLEDADDLIADFMDALDSCPR